MLLGDAVLRTGIAEEYSRFTSRSIDGHVHDDERDGLFGWICVIHRDPLFTPSGPLTPVLSHQYPSISRRIHPMDVAGRKRGVRNLASPWSSTPIARDLGLCFDTAESAIDQL